MYAIMTIDVTATLTASPRADAFVSVLLMLKSAWKTMPGRMLPVRTAQ